jgi:hypothetical protein
MGAQVRISEGHRKEDHMSRFKGSEPPAKSDQTASAPPDAIADAAKKRSAAQADNSMIIDALLAERRGYVVRGLDDRIAAVDAELDRYGYSADNT